jgi:putative PIN family toxin of toxin-antitoxin system
MKRVVLDTNALLRCISSKSKYSFVLDLLFAGDYQICISNDIVLEYEEKIAGIFSKDTAELILGAFSLSSSVINVEVKFNLDLIHEDQDDNKFVDCCFVSNAHFIVTNDKHFNKLKEIDFPKFNVITLEDFAESLREK